jgi:hypothetical protein
MSTALLIGGANVCVAERSYARDKRSEPILRNACSMFN